ncbi:diguanylate cyclase (GGDEF)-like protein [Shimia isoporae]|uniref:diguanylate cyclase n=1 Tax=Shimia isoporae TaxID=647720 RepID=A0A4R1NPH6_9RHOB|nr:GGDEF domain-containing protein [Shimia isoporae]TCL09749.1 diguanylate cyclase (GGDEF)-like protein [Shimia isoporae]
MSIGTQALQVTGKHIWIWCAALFCALLSWAETTQAEYSSFDAGAILEEDIYRYPLKGDWMFAWDRFLTPEEAVTAFKEQSLPSKAVPSNWFGTVPSAEDNPHDHGIASYVAPLTLPEIPNSDLVLHVGEIHDAYRLIWVPLDAPEDAVEIATRGNLAGPELVAHRNLRHSLPFSGDGLLLVHVRKSMFDWGGITLAPYVATADKEGFAFYVKSMIGGITIGALLLIMLRNGMLYLSGLRDVAAGVLAMITMMIIVRAVAVENMVEMLFGTQWHATRMRIEVGLVAVMSSWTFRMLEVLFPRPMPQIVRLPIHIGAHLIGLATLLVPLHNVSDMLILAQIIALISFIPGGVHIVSALRTHSNEARLLAISAALCLAAGLNDIYASNSDNYNVHLIPVSVVVLVMFLSQVIGNRAALAIARSDLLEQEKEQLERAHDDAVHMARHDHLTGLLNRQSFDHYWAQSWLDSIENQTPLTVVLFDIDHFKSINDNHGHPIGDAVLKSLAERLTSCNLRKSDRLCRYGGEEFALILPNSTQRDGEAMAERLRKAIAANPLHASDPEITVTCSFGVASTDLCNEKSAEGLLTRADEALYAAKANGRNCVFSPRGASQKAAA